MRLRLHWNGKQPWSEAIPNQLNPAYDYIVIPTVSKALHFRDFFDRIDSVEAYRCHIEGIYEVWFYRKEIIKRMDGDLAKVVAWHNRLLDSNISIDTATMGHYNDIERSKIGFINRELFLKRLKQYNVPCSSLSRYLRECEFIIHPHTLKDTLSDLRNGRSTIIHWVHPEDIDTIVMSVKVPLDRGLRALLNDKQWDTYLNSKKLTFTEAKCRFTQTRKARLPLGDIHEIKDYEVVRTLSRLKALGRDNGWCVARFKEYHEAFTMDRSVFVYSPKYHTLAEYVGTNEPNVFRLRQHRAKNNSMPEQDVPKTMGFTACKH
jgi:hypothetical protein